MKKNLFLAICFCLMLGGIAMAQEADMPFDDIVYGPYQGEKVSNAADAAAAFAEYLGVDLPEGIDWDEWILDYNGFTYHDEEDCYEIDPSKKYDDLAWDYILVDKSSNPKQWLIAADGTLDAEGNLDFTNGDDILYLDGAEYSDLAGIYNHSFILKEGSPLQPPDDGGDTVPEPSSIILLGSAMLGLAAFGKRKLGNRK